MRHVVVVLEVVVALALIALQHVGFAALALSHELLQYAPGTAEHIGGNELWLVAIQLLGIPAALLIADAYRRVFRAGLVGLASRHARAVTAVAALVATVGAMVATYGFHGAVFTDDERTLLMQARMLFSSGFTGPAPAPHAAFVHHFVVAVDGDRWAGIFPPGQALLLGIGLAAGSAHLTQWLACGLTVWTVARFAAREWGDETSVIVAGLLATSPALVLTAATLHNVVPTVCCVSGVVYAASAFARSGSARWGLLVGAASGLALTCRPLDGVVLTIAALGWIATSSAPRRRKLECLALAFATGIPFVIFQLASYRAISGNILVSPYDVWLSRDWPGAHLFGFGATVWNYQHTVATAFAKTAAATIRLDSWAFGWPLSLAGAALWLSGAGRDRTTKILFAMTCLHGVGYFFYAFAAVQDFGSYYHLFTLPTLAVLTARALVVAGQRHGWLVPLAGAATVVGLATFWPLEVEHLRAIADRTEAPIVAAEAVAKDGPILVFHGSMHPSPTQLSSWVFFAPLPGPELDDPVLWMRTFDPKLVHAAIERYPERRAFAMKWVDGTPRLLPVQVRER